MGRLRALLLLGLMAGCSDANTPPPISDSDGGPDKGADVNAPPPCSTPAEGCPCPDAGAQYYCGVIYRVSGSYITCSPGYLTCEANGSWGPCEGPAVYDGN